MSAFQSLAGFAFAAAKKESPKCDGMGQKLERGRKNHCKESYKLTVMNGVRALPAFVLAHSPGELSPTFQPSVWLHCTRSFRGEGQVDGGGVGEVKKPPQHPTLKSFVPSINISCVPTMCQKLFQASLEINDQNCPSSLTLVNRSLHCASPLLGL